MKVKTDLPQPLDEYVICAEDQCSLALWGGGPSALAEVTHGTLRLTDPGPCKANKTGSKSPLQF